MARIGQKYLRIRIHVENQTKVFENWNLFQESNKSIRELKFMSRIGQKYLRIRIHVENQTKVFKVRIHVENQRFSLLKILQLLENFTTVPDFTTMLNLQL